MAYQIIPLLENRTINLNPSASGFLSAQGGRFTRLLIAYARYPFTLLIRPYQAPKSLLP